MSLAQAVGGWDPMPEGLMCCFCFPPGGLSTAYGGLTSPGLSYGLSSFQPNFSSAGGSSSFSRTKAVVVKKIETRDGKLVSESSDVLPK